MRQLNDDLDSLSAKIDKAYDLLNDISYDVGKVQENFDLYDFSIDTLNDWSDDLNPLINKMGRLSEWFDEFAFDGDSIREVDEELERMVDEKEKEIENIYNDLGGEG